MGKESPDYPPGPRGPEDDAPGVELTLTSEQFEFIGQVVKRIGRAVVVRIEDRGAGWLQLTVRGPGTEIIEERLVASLGNSL